MAKLLEDHGIRIQKSFFQCDINKDRLEFLKRAMLKIIRTREDSLFIYPLCEDCLKLTETTGTGSLIKIEDFEIL
jgi:CRISPR-associated protein Cas2